MHSNSIDGPARPPGRLPILLAFLAVYLIWGSTYLAIRIAVATLPPFLMAAIRFLVAGGILMGALRVAGTELPGKRHWRNAAIAGLLLFVGGNGLVVWAAQRLPSGLIALLVATTPIWMALIDWLRPGGNAPGARAVVGILVGLGGVVSLFVGKGINAGPEGLSLPGVGAVLVASIAWAAGSLFLRSAERPASGWMAVAAQMICGGGGLLAVALLRGEARHVEVASFSAGSIWAFFYLIVIGSWVGFGAYSWLLEHSTPARVSTYAYVNPIVAVSLGCLFAGESFTSRTAFSAGVTLAGVAIIMGGSRQSLAAGRGEPLE